MSDNMTEFFRIKNQPAPARQFGEGPTQYRQRCLSLATMLLPRGHVLQGVNVRRMPAAAVEGLEGLVYDRAIEEFKAPTGPLREATETCPRTNRVVTRFFGSPENAWGPFKGKARHATFTPGMGRGVDSPRGRAVLAARAEALRAAGL